MRRRILIITLLMCLCAWLAGANAASVGATLTVDGAAAGSYATVQEAVDAVTQLAGSEFVIEIAAGTVSEPLNIGQQPDKSLTVRPQANAAVTFTNTITIDGNGRFAGPETLTIQGLSFDMTSGAAANCIDFNLIPPRTGYCYAHNIVIRDCDFKGIYDVTVAVQSVAGGINNVSIIDCAASSMHSLAQLKAVSGTALIQGCTVSDASGGVNFYGTANLIVTSCDFEVTGYAVRSGQTSGAVSSQGSVVIDNSVLETSGAQDGALVLRGDSTRTITISHSEITNTAGGPAIQNLNAASAGAYAVTLINTEVSGDIAGIDAATVTTIDDPNVPSGPVRPTSQSNALIAVIVMLSLLVCGLTAVVMCGRRWGHDAL